jgi:hypothetical protein
MLTFWNKLILSNKLSSKISRLLYTLNINGAQGFKWIELVKSTFYEIGLSFMYSDQQYGNFILDNRSLVINILCKGFKS